MVLHVHLIKYSSKWSHIPIDCNNKVWKMAFGMYCRCDVTFISITYLSVLNERDYYTKTSFWKVPIIKVRDIKFDTMVRISKNVGHVFGLNGECTEVSFTLVMRLSQMVTNYSLLLPAGIIVLYTLAHVYHVHTNSAKLV